MRGADLCFEGPGTTLPKKVPGHVLNRWSLVWGSGALGLPSQDLEHAFGFLVPPGFQFDGSSSNDASRQKMHTGNSRRLNFRLRTTKIFIVVRPKAPRSHEQKVLFVSCFTNLSYASDRYTREGKQGSTNIQIIEGLLHEQLLLSLRTASTRQTTQQTEKLTCP